MDRSGYVYSWSFKRRTDNLDSNVPDRTFSHCTIFFGIADDDTSDCESVRGVSCRLYKPKIFKNETGTAAAGYAIAFLFLVTMITGIGSSVYGTVAVFAVVTSMMTAVNTVFISLLPIHFQKEGKVATVSGILNAVTYLGSAVASVLFGWTAEKAGWTGTEMVWCFCAATGMIVCLVVLKRWKNSRRDIYTGS